MSTLRVTGQADLALVFEASRQRHTAEEWEKVTGGGYVTTERFVAHCIAHAFPSIGFECDGKPIGGMIFDGTAAHIEVLPEYHSRWGVLWGQATQWMFSLKDPMQVRIDIANEKAVRFMERNRWRRLAVDEKFITYEMTASVTPHYRRQARSQARREARLKAAAEN